MTIGDKMARGMAGAASSPLETRADTRYIIILSLDLRSDPPHVTCCTIMDNEGGNGESVFIIWSSEASLHCK